MEYTSRLNTSEEGAYNVMVCVCDFNLVHRLEPDVMSSSTTDTESQSGTASKVVVQELALPTCNIANAMVSTNLDDC